MDDSKGKILIYQNEKGDTKIDVFFDDGTILLPQSAIALLNQVTPQNITMHIKDIYEDGGLDEAATCKDYLQVQTEGSREVNRSLLFMVYRS